MSTTKSEPTDISRTADAPSSDARRRKGQITRDRILAVATRLFAEQGYNGVALRQVCLEAKVNLALMSYHFGTKEQLLFEIFQHGTRFTNQEREKNLFILETRAAHEEISIEDLLRAFVSPTLKKSMADDADELNFLKLSGRLATDPTPEVRRVMANVYDNVAVRFVRMLRPTCAHLGDGEFFMRLVFFYGTLLYTRADTGRVISLARQMSVALPTIDGAKTCELMIPFLAAGFRAPANWK